MENDDEYNDFINDYGNIIGSIINVADQQLITGQESETDDINSARLLATGSAFFLGKEILNEVE